jgi:ATP-dependent protease ClpP protease subunit
MVTEKHTPARNSYYRLIAAEGSDEATVLLYGYIGESYSWDSEKGWVMDGVTDIGFVTELNRLAQEYKVIHLRLNSYGGDFGHGNAILTAIQNCKAEVHTWNDGIAASMAADIWMVGHQRHMAKNALLMIHPTWSIVAGNAKEMRETADILDKMSDAAIIATAASTGIPEDEMRRRYYTDYADHWLTYNDVQRDGLTNTTDEYEAAGVEKSIETMTYKQLVQHFERSGDSADSAEASGMLARIRAAFQKKIEKIAGRSTPPASLSPTTNKDMIIEDFRKSLADGTLDREAVLAHLADTQPVPEPQPDPLEAVQQELASLKAALVAANKRLDEYGAAPGASKAAPDVPAGDPPVGDGAPDPLAEYNTALANAAKRGTVPFRPVQ